MEELDQNAQDADHQQDEGDVRIVQAVEEPLDRVLADRYGRRAFGVDDDRPGRGRDGLAIGLVQDVVEAGGDAVDGVGIDRFLSRVGLRLLDRRDSPGHRGGMALLSDAPDRGDRVVHHLVGLGLAVRGGDVRTARRHRRSGADVGTRSHVGQVRRERDERARAGRLGAGRTDPHDGGDLRVQRRVDSQHRVLGTAKGVELDDHGSGPVGLRPPNCPGHVVGHDVIDDAARWHDDHLGTRRRRDSAIRRRRRRRLRDGSASTPASPGHAYEPKEGSGYEQRGRQPGKREGRPPQRPHSGREGRRKVENPDFSTLLLHGPGQRRSLVRQGRCPAVGGQPPQAAFHLDVGSVLDIGIAHAVPPSADSIWRRRACRAA